MKVLIGIQARSDSTRFPGKIYAQLGDKPVLKHVLDSALKVQSMHKAIDYIVAVLAPMGDEKLEKWCCDHGVMNVFSGSPLDLVERYRGAVDHYEADAVIRVTGDCPMLPSAIIEACAKNLTDCDYTSNTVFRTYPEGYDIQGCSRDAMKWFDENQKEEREHPFVRFDYNAIVREEYIKAGLTWKPIYLKESAVLQKHSVDTRDDLQRLQKFFRTPGQK